MARTDQEHSSISESLFKSQLQAIRSECNAMEESLKDADNEILRKEDEAFLIAMTGQDTFELQKRQLSELEDKDAQHLSLLKARSSRKAAKEMLRKMTRDTKLRDMKIQSQSSANKLVNESRIALANKNKNFDKNIAHMERKHQNQIQNLINSQERKFNDEKAILGLEVDRIVSAERRTNMMKKWEEKMNYQKSTDKRMMENLREIQQIELKHAKESFELEIILLDEMQSLRLGHQKQFEDHDSSRYLESSAVKEKLIKLKEDYKKMKMELHHQQDIKRIKNIHKAQSRKMREIYNDRMNYHSSTSSSKVQSAQSSIPSSRGEPVSSDRNEGMSAKQMNGAIGALRNMDSLTQSSELASALEKIQIQEELVKETVRTGHELRVQIAATQKDEIEIKEKSSGDRIYELISEHETEMLNLRKTQELDVNELNSIFQREMQMQQEILDTEYKALIERKLMNSLLNNVVDAVINIDTIGTITKFNKSAERIFGWTCEEVINNNIKMIMPSRYSQNHDEYLLRYVTTGVKRVVGGGRQLFGLRKNGTEFPMYLSLSEVKQEGLHTFTGIIRDLSEEFEMREKYKLEEETRQAAHQKLVDEMNMFKDQAGALIRNVLPEAVAEDLMNGVQTLPQSYAQATVFFCDIAGFSEITNKSTPEQVVTTLNSIFTGMDMIISKYDAYKVETVGDVYLVVSGIPATNEDRHAAQIALMSLEILKFAHDFKIDHIPGHKLKLRIGISSGPVVAGVVGIQMPRYCLFGDTVNTASRMESTGQAMRIQITQATHDYLIKTNQFCLTLRGQTEVKGKGVMKTYWLSAKEGSPFEIPEMISNSTSVV